MDVEESGPLAMAAGEIQAFLICDIRGYSTFTSQRGAAAAAQLATTFTNLCQDAVAARGGRVLGSRGDDVLAAFDLSDQAVRTGLDIQWACIEETASNPNFPLGVGVGIDLGEAVSVHDGHHGVAINMAARLCAAAVAGQILVTSTVVGAARRAADLRFERQARLELKGFDRPIEVFEVVSRRAIGTPTADEASSAGPLPLELDRLTPLSGRETELSWLRGTWRQARRGHGRIVFVGGPAGAGKTRLAAELAGYVRAGGGRVHYAGAGGAARGETTAAIADACSSTAPGLWVLDDLTLHPESVAALAAAADDIQARPALVLGLGREVRGDPAFSRFVDQIDEQGDGYRALPSLDVHDVRSIASWYLRDVSDLPAESILRASGGIPAAVHELVTQWAGDEAKRRLQAAADWLAEGRSKQAAGLRFADNLITAHLRRIYDPTGAGEPSLTCPYKGLGSYEPSDAAFFFGREHLVGELAARTVGPGLLGVVGPSGSGKSSVVLAGLLPSLAAGLLPGSEHWDHVVFRPGGRPVAALDQALSGARGGDRLIVVADQFEEIFTATEDGLERDAFVARIVELAQQPDVVVVITIRADFTGHCAPYAELASLLAANFVLVGPMTGDQLRRVVEAPARRVGLRVESSLVDALVAEVAGEPGGLPLLSTALVQLWQVRDGDWMRFDSYQRSGGVRTAVARLAEACYARLTATERDLARVVFLRLVGGGEGEAAARRRVALSEFDAHQDPAVGAVLSVLTRDRLLTSDDGSVEIAHEALLREWPRLKGWLDEDSARRQLRGHLTQSAMQWAQRGRDTGDLYRGARLSAVLDSWRDDDRELNAVEREFLAQSRKESERELVRQRRANGRLRALLAATAGLLAVALIAGIFAVVQRNHARSNQRTAQARALTSDAERIGTVAETEPNLDLSLLLGVAAVKLDDLPETRGDLLAALQASPAAFRFVRPSSSEITGLAISPGGQLLATGDAAGVIRFESMRTWKPTGPDVALEGPVAPSALRFSPDGRTVAVAAGQGDSSHVYLIDVASRRSRLLGSWPGAVAPVPNGSTTIAFSPDGAKIAIALADWPPNAATPLSERLVLLDVATGKVVWQRVYPMLAGQEEAQLAFTPTGTLVTSAEHGSTDLWDPRSGRITRRFPIGGRFALSSDGRRAVIGLNTSSAITTAFATTVEVLDLRTGARRRLQALPVATWMASVVFTPDGGSVVGGSLDGDVRVWDVSSGSIVQTFASRSGGRTQVAIAPSGDTVVSGVDDGSVTAWDLAGNQSLGRSFGWSTPPNSCSSNPCQVVNPIGTIMATDESDGTVDLVDLRSQRWYATLPSDHGLVANGLVFTPDSRELVTGDAGGHVLVWDMQSRAVVRKLQVANPVTWLAVSPDGRLLAVQTQAQGASDSHVEVLKFATGAVVRTYTVADGSGGVAFSADGRELAALGCCSPGSKIEVWDSASGRELFSPLVAGQAQSIAFSPTSGMLAAGTAAGQIAFWDARSGTSLGNPITASASNALAIAFSSDGRLLAASFRNGDTLLFDLRSGRQLGNSFPVVGAVFTVPVFARDGDLVIDYVGTATEWPTGLGAWERFACQVAGRDITPSEWSRALPGRRYEPVCSG